MKKLLIAMVIATAMVGCSGNQTRQNQVITKEMKIERVKRLQFLLNEAGYEAGKIDGIVGVDTRGAIDRFLTDRELNILEDDYNQMIIELEKKEVFVSAGSNSGEFIKR